MARTPMILVAGGLGSGKTTLLRHLLAEDRRGGTTLGRAALIVNEFGEIGIDGQILEGRSLRLVELPGGCVCCSLAGEFEDAVRELIDTVAPDRILVETTGVAEADALVLDIEETLPQVRLEAVLVVVDADAWERFPQTGYAERSQLEVADLMVLNKTDLIDGEAVRRLRCRLAEINAEGRIVEAERGRIDPDLIVLDPSPLRSPRGRRGGAHGHRDLESFHWVPATPLRRLEFEAAVGTWPYAIYRAKGFLRLVEGGRWLFNYVAGRWELERAADEGPVGLVWIGPQAAADKDRVLAGMATCEPPSCHGAAPLRAGGGAPGSSDGV